MIPSTIVNTGSMSRLAHVCNLTLYILCGSSFIVSCVLFKTGLQSSASGSAGTLGSEDIILAFMSTIDINGIALVTNCLS